MEFKEAEKNSKPKESPWMITYTKDAITKNSTRDFHASHTQMERIPEVDKFLHGYKYKEKTVEEWIGIANAANDQQTLNKLKSLAPPIAAKNWNEILEHSDKIIRMHKGLAEIAEKAQEAGGERRTELLSELKNDVEVFSKKIRLDNKQIQGDALAYGAVGAKSNIEREDFLKDAAKAGFSASSVLSTARYLDTIYGTSLASQFTPKISPLIRNQALNVASGSQMNVLNTQIFNAIEHGRSENRKKEDEEKEEREIDRRIEGMRQEGKKSHDKAQGEGLDPQNIIKDGVFRLEQSTTLAAELVFAGVATAEELVKNGVEKVNDKINSPEFKRLEPDLQVLLLRSYVSAMNSYVDNYAKNGKGLGR